MRARSHLAWTLAELGDFAGAYAAAEAGLKLADASGHSYSICHGCLGLGGVRVRQGEFKSSISILARGLAASERVPLLRPPIAADLGLAYARCGNIDEGLTHLHAAVDAAKSMGRMSRLPLMLVKCGEIHLLVGDRKEAIQLAETALRLAVQQKERGNQVYARHLVAEIHVLESDADAAARFYREALDLATEIGMAGIAARCHAGLPSSTPERRGRTKPKRTSALRVKCTGGWACASGSTGWKPRPQKRLDGPQRICRPEV